MKQLLPVLCLSLCPIFAFGCSQGSGKHQVTGLVELDGQPIAEGNITFQAHGKDISSEGAEIRQGTYSVSIAAGTFSVSIYAPQKVALMPGEPAMVPGQTDKVINAIPEHYRAKEALVVNVTRSEQIDFKLTSKKK